MGCVLHAVGHDDKDGVLGNILRSCILVHIPDMVDRAAERINECGTAAHLILRCRHRLNFPDIHTVMDDPAVAGKENCGDQRFALGFPLLLNHAVETADRILLQSEHGTALIKNKDHFCQIFSHC